MSPPDYFTTYKHYRGVFSIHIAVRPARVTLCGLNAYNFDSPFPLTKRPATCPACRERFTALNRKETK